MSMQLNISGNNERFPGDRNQILQVTIDIITYQSTPTINIVVCRTSKSVHIQIRPEKRNRLLLF